MPEISAVNILVAPAEVEDARKFASRRRPSAAGIYLMIDKPIHFENPVSQIFSLMGNFFNKFFHAFSFVVLSIQLHFTVVGEFLPVEDHILRL
jgi:hypothetical protein